MLNKVDMSLPLLIARAVDASWRRRFLLLTPMLVLVIVSILLALFLPGGYLTRSLVMMQESTGNNLLSKEVSNPTADRVQQIVAGIQTLLTSDYILSQVVSASDTHELDSRQKQLQIASLRNRVSVELVGGDFLEFRLTGATAKGLGDLLQRIMTRLTEALVVQGGVPVGEFLLNKRQEELEAAEKEHSELAAKLNTVLPAGSEQADQELRQTRLALQGTAEELAKLGENTQANRELGDEDRQGASAGDGDRATKSNQQQTARAALLKKRSDLLITETDQVALLQQYQDIEKRLNENEKFLAAARASLEEYKKRVGPVVTNRRTTLMTAPERMVVIDPPKDPEFRSKSRLVYVFSGLIGGLLLGVALVIMAEWVDPMLRWPEHIIAISGLPIVTQVSSPPTSLPGTDKLAEGPVRQARSSADGNG